MKGIELLPFLSREQKEKLTLSAQNYLRFARIHFSIVSAQDNEIIIKIWQTENKAEKYLTVKELIERGKEVFSIVPGKIHFRPIPFKVDSLENVDAKWVSEQLEKNSLKVSDLVRLLNINKAVLSRTLSSKNMTKSSKAMFYYFFKSLEK